MPKITVIMPLYNAEKYIEKTLASILSQSYADFEILLIDDSSTDNTLKLAENIKDSRIRILHNPKNMGIAFSRNKGLEQTNSQYVALMDDDDLTVPDRFEKQIEYLENHKDIDVVGGRYCVIDKADRVIRTFQEPLNNPEYIKAYIMLYDPIANGSAMIRNDFIQNHHIRYQEDCLGMEDYRFWIDCSVKGRITNLQDVLLYWRQTEENQTTRINALQSEERAKKYAKLQEYAFKVNGYSLSDREISVINTMYPEDLKAGIVAADSMKELYEIFQKIIRQARDMNVSNEKEVEVMCRKMFSFRMEYSTLWS